MLLAVLMPNVEIGGVEVEYVVRSVTLAAKTFAQVQRHGRAAAAEQVELDAHCGRCQPRTGFD